MLTTVVPHNLVVTIRMAAALYNIGRLDMMAIARIESNFNPAAKNPHSTATGLYQFIDATARRYGIDPRDPTQSAGAAALMAYQNRIHLLKHAHVGIGSNLYLAHQQGPSRAVKILGAALGEHPLSPRDLRLMEMNVPATSLAGFLKEDTDEHKAIYFLNVWSDKFAEAGRAWAVGDA